MSSHVHRLSFTSRAALLAGCALLGLTGFDATLRAQVALPELKVTGAKPKPKPRTVRRRVPAPAVAARATPTSPATPVNAATAKNNAFDNARTNLYTTAGTTSDTISHDTIQALPQGTNAPVEKVLLQAPGVSQDSAASGSIHVRNDHANVQFRINGVMLPDGVTGFGSILDTEPDRQHFADHRRAAGRIRDAHGGPRRHHHAHRHFQQFRQRQPLRRQPRHHPAELRIRRHLRQHLSVGAHRSAPVVGKAAPSPQRPTASPACSTCSPAAICKPPKGIENPTAQPQRHSRLFPAGQRLRLHVDLRRPGDAPEPDRRHVHQLVPDSQRPRPARRLERQSAGHQRVRHHQFQFGDSSTRTSMRTPSSACWRCSGRCNGFDGQLSYFTRYNFLHFMPDPVGDLLLNGIASDITRKSYTNGVQGDASYIDQRRRIRCAPASPSAANRPRSATNRWSSRSTRCGNPIDAPFTITDNVSKLGWLAGVYVQDEWKVTHNFTHRMPACASTRCGNTSTPISSARASASPTSRSSSPPSMPATRATSRRRCWSRRRRPISRCSRNTTGAPASGGTDPVLPERSHYFDAGVDQKIPFGCALADRARLQHSRTRRRRLLQDRDATCIDNGNFGQALVLSAFNYAQGHKRRRRVQRQVPQRQFPGLRQPRRRPGESHQCGVEPVSVRQRHAARRSRRSDGTPVHRLATGSIPITTSS